jgi:hypothetical protein
MKEPKLYCVNNGETLKRLNRINEFLKDHSGYRAEDEFEW